MKSRPAPRPAPSSLPSSRQAAAASQPERPAKRRRPIRCEEDLKSVALYYLERFPCTTEKLRIHLGKKLKDAIAADEARPTDAWRWLDQVIETLTRVRLLDDVAWSESRASTLHRRGRATSVIRRDLAQKGAPEAAIDAAESSLGDDRKAIDLASAVRLAKKKSLGPFAKADLAPARPRTPRPGKPPVSDREAAMKVRQRHLATLARAGFSFEIAKTILDARHPDDLAELLDRDR